MNDILGISTDLLEQFKGKPNIEALCKVLDNQIKQLTDTFDKIEYETSLDTARGKQLDKIGEIVGLTRAEGALLCGEKINFNVLDDARYRKYLKYAAYMGSNSCTYYDLINSLQMVWGDTGTVKYIEDSTKPATIVLELSTGNEETLHLGDIPSIKPAGVDIQYRISLTRKIRIAHEIHFYTSGIACGTHYCGTYPSKA